MQPAISLLDSCAYKQMDFSRKTQWFDPRDIHTKPASMADCIGDELPFGWEVAYGPGIGVYYIDHMNRRNQVEDPRDECRNMQLRMVENYMRQAESLDPMSTSSVSLTGTGSQVQDRQSLERLNSSFLNLEVCDSSSSQAGVSLPVTHHYQHQEQQVPATEYKLSSPSSSERNSDREVLQQSLLDSKSRVALLKRELDTNARLLTLIDRFKTRDEEFAVEV